MRHFDLLEEKKNALKREYQKIQSRKKTNKQDFREA